MAGPAGSKGRATRESIRQAAAVEFRTRGYGAATLEGIAHRLGMTRQAVLYHFRSKDELLDAVVGPYLDTLTSVLEAGRRPDETSRAWRRRLIEAFIDAIIDDALAAGILFRDVTSWERVDVRERVVACSDGFRTALTDPALDPGDPTVRRAILDVAIPISDRIDRLERGRTGEP
jgi:AcrR family transcriptional regulator